ncbi:MAG: cytochrome c biogenesis protein ResB, partial [Candidatus Scalindua sp.]
SSTTGFRTMNNRIFEGGSIPVPQSSEYSLRLNKMDVAFTNKGSMLRMDAYLSLIRDKKVIRDKVVKLNQPLLFRGNAVYITHHGNAPESMEFKLSGKNIQETIKIKFQERSATSDSGYTLRLGDLLQDFARDSKGKAYSASKQFRNPAMELMIFKGEKFLLSGWVLLKYPGKAPLAFDGLKLVFSGLSYGPYAVLTINKDPGILIVLSGAMIFLLALIGLLFIKGEEMELVRRNT